MISEAKLNEEIDGIIANAIREDVGPGDYSSLACIPDTAQGKAKLLVKEKGIIAGVAFAQKVFAYVDETLEVEVLIQDGAEIEVGDIVLWHEDYYEVDTVRENQLFLGRDNSYNFTEYGSQFGKSISIIVDCHLTRGDKVGIAEVV